jgi:hypothetical protein
MGFKTVIKLELEVTVKGKQKPDVAISKYFKKRANVTSIDIKSQEVEVIKTEVKVDEQARALNMLKRIATEILGPKAEFRGHKGYGGRIEPRIYPKGQGPYSEMKLLAASEELEVIRWSGSGPRSTQKFKLADPGLFDNVRNFLLGG